MKFSRILAFGSLGLVMVLFVWLFVGAEEVSAGRIVCENLDGVTYLVSDELAEEAAADIEAGDTPAVCNGVAAGRRQALIDGIESSGFLDDCHALAVAESAPPPPESITGWESPFVQDVADYMLNLGGGSSNYISEEVRSKTKSCLLELAPNLQTNIDEFVEAVGITDGGDAADDAITTLIEDNFSTVDYCYQGFIVPVLQSYDEYADLADFVPSVEEVAGIVRGADSNNGSFPGVLSNEVINGFRNCLFDAIPDLEDAVGGRELVEEGVSNVEPLGASESSGQCAIGSSTEVNQAEARRCLFQRGSEIIRFLSLLIGVVLVGSTIFAGIQYTTAGADSGKLQKAKARLASNIVVLVLFIFSAAILNWVLPG